jgi:hypothetical protein
MPAGFMSTHPGSNDVVDIAVANRPADRREYAGLHAGDACHEGVPDRIVMTRIAGEAGSGFCMGSQVSLPLWVVS